MPGGKRDQPIDVAGLATSPPLAASDFAAMAAFRSALRRFQAFSEAHAQQVGLTMQQHQALLAIKAHDGSEPMTIGELADALLIKNHSAVGLVARLVDRGLVKRESSSLDKRRVVLIITADADALVQTVTRRNLSELNRSAPVIRDLLSTLRKLDKTSKT